jgi:hypothetical protein
MGVQLLFEGDKVFTTSPDSCMPDLAGVPSLMSVLLSTIPRARSVMDWASEAMQRLKSAAQLFNLARKVEELM